MKKLAVIEWQGTAYCLPGWQVTFKKSGIYWQSGALGELFEWHDPSTVARLNSAAVVDVSTPEWICHQKGEIGC